MTADQKRNPLASLARGAWRGLRGVFIFLGALVFVSALLSSLAAMRAEALPEKFVLDYMFTPELADVVTRPDFNAGLLRAPATVRDVVEALDMAAKDDRVAAFHAVIDALYMSPAEIQELRAAVMRFRDGGKPARVFAYAYGGPGGGSGDYYLASAFGEVWLQPVGSVTAGHVSIETPYFKGLFDKIGVYADFVHKGRYKSAPESLTDETMSAPAREMTRALVDDIAAVMRADISGARKVDMAALAAASPFGAAAARAAKLVDRIGYLDEMDAAAGEDIEHVNLLDYAAAAAPRAPLVSRLAALSGEKAAHKGNKLSSPVIALVTLGGEIGGAGAIDPFAVSETFADVLDDPAVKAVVVRLDSPGGAPEAAEAIRRDIARLREAGLPVVVSMGGAAASGGYWIASAADNIVAQPSTITGSIGVFGGKFVLEGLWKKLGVNWVDIGTAGGNAFTLQRAFTPDERARLDTLMQEIYDAFVARVAEGRKLPPEKVRDLAEGRVYTGRQALALGLVDRLGGVEVAVEQARKLASLGDVPLKKFPPDRTGLELLLEMLGKEGLGGVRVDALLQGLAHAAPRIR